MFWKKKAVSDPDGLGQVLWCPDKHCSWTMRDAFEGTSILGGNGSGKTSGSGMTLARSFLASGMGGLVMTTKPDEFRLWEKLCTEAGRSEDLVLFGADKPWRFNFLDYEMQHSGGGGVTENLVNLFSVVTEISDRRSGKGGQEDQAYWKNAQRQLMRNAIEVLVIAVGKVSVPLLYELVTSAPQSLEEAGSEAWQSRSSLYRVLDAGRARAASPRQEHDFRLAARYWLEEFPALAEKTRSIIVSSFTSIIDVFNRGHLRELFSSETNITPEAAQDGKIIVIDLPVKVWNELGQYAQVVWKFLFQRATERRLSTRPLFLWADEAANFVTSYDCLFQSTARSSRCATVYLCQNLPMYYAANGGEQTGKSATDALMGCLGTKIFHANSDVSTNEWAAQLIGKELRLLKSTSMQHGHHQFFSDDNDRPHASSTISEHMEFKLIPSSFTTLRKGGPDNGNIVEGVLFQNGRVFPATADNFMFATFHQKG